MIRSIQRTTPIVLALTLAACDGRPAPVAPDVPVAFSHGGGSGDVAAVHAWLGALRAAIAPYHRFEVAGEAGYTVSLTPCMESPGVGGMGFHYGDVTRIDGTVEPLAPEVLLYEPQKNGGMRLVGVEFLVPLAASPNVAPQIHGIPFHANEAFQVWALHVWVGRHNPSGTFVDWNPNVTCEHAP